MFDDDYYSIEVRRDHIFEDSLNCLTEEGITKILLEKNLRIVIKGEAGIDEGGVKREFFKLHYWFDK